MKLTTAEVEIFLIVVNTLIIPALILSYRTLQIHLRQQSEEMVKVCEEKMRLIARDLEKRIQYNYRRSEKLEMKLEHREEVLLLRFETILEKIKNVEDHLIKTTTFTTQSKE